MKSYMRKNGFYILNLVLVVGLMLVATTVIAQPPPPPPPPPPGVPVDGGIIGLLALGIGYGVKKIYSKD
jgi:hypothetical protein